MSRLFVAVWPPDEVVDALSTFPRERVPGVRWTTPQRWHVTLRFLGEADPDLAAAALAGLHHPTVAARSGERPVGRLGRGLLVLPVDGLDSLASAVSAVMTGIGQPERHHGFVGHVTLARLKGVPACGLVGARLQASWTVGEVSLVESTLRQTGAEYRTISTVALDPHP